MAWGTAIGFAGIALVLCAYLLLSSGKLSPDDPRYPLMNILGTAGILVSLSSQWNLSAFVTNASWLTIGILALVRIHRKGRL